MAFPLRSSFRPSRHRQSGFTLVEVALAIGIVAFAFVALLALLPAGNNAFRRSVDLAVAGQISQRVINDAVQADFKLLLDNEHADVDDDNDEYYTFRAPLRRSPGFRYFDDQGREIIFASPGQPTPEEKLRVIYQVNTRVMPRAVLPSDRQAKKRPFQTGHPLAQVTVQVAHNPNLIEIPIKHGDKDPQRNLWVPTKDQSGIEIYTYSALVGRNE